MKRVLCIAYYFPPMGLSGVQRTVKFLKYLPEFGWEPAVLTVKETAYWAYDASLFGDLRPEMPIVRTGSLDPLRLIGLLRPSASALPRGGEGERGRGGLVPPEVIRRGFSWWNHALFVPDNKIGWLPFALFRGNRWLSEASPPVDLIYATAPPFTAHLVGAILATRFRKPLVLDFRDPWSTNQFVSYPTAYHRLLNQALERVCLRQAGACIATNEGIVEGLRENGPGKRPRLEVVFHGFDPEDFEGHPAFPASPSPAEGQGGKGAGEQRGRSSERFTITHSGVFYERITPRYFLQALRRLLDERPELEGRIRARFVGLFRRENEALVKTLELEQVVEVTSYVPHRKSVEYLLSSDVLWFMIGEGPSSASWAPGKLFEYLGARKPILACVPEGTAARTVRAIGNSTVVPPDDVDQIKDAIWRYYQASLDGTLQETDREVVRPYDRRRLTGRLAGIFEDVLRYHG